MQIKWVDDLLAVVEAKSFSRAAEIRCVTQSALSRRIRSLEEWIGVELIDRSTYPVQLTRAGQIFCDQGRFALTTFMELRETLRQGERMPGRSIHLMAGHTLSVTFLPKWIAALQRRNGYFNARVLSTNIQEAVIALAEGSCDLMFGYNHPQTPITLDPEKFVGLRIGTDALIPVSVPLSSGEPKFLLASSETEPIPYLAYTATTFLGRLVEMLLHDALHRPPLRCLYQADMALHLVKMVREGYGIAWLPQSAVEEEMAAGRLVRAGDERWSVALEIWSFKSITNTNPTLGDLWASLEQSARA